MSTDHDPSAAAAPIELRVLHGPQAGARLPLEPGQPYTLGTADHCTVILAGAQVAEEHALLSVDEDGIVVEPLGGRVGTPTGEALGAGERLELGTVLQFGLVKLTAARAGDAWPADEALEPRPPAPDLMEVVPGQELADSAAAPQPVPPAARAPRPPPARKLRPALVYLAAASVAVAGAWLAVQGVTEAKPMPAAAGPASPAAAPAQAPASAAEPDAGPVLAELLKGFAHGALSSRRTEQGAWVVHGRLRSDAELQLLREALAAAGVPVQLDVMLESERLAALKRFAESNQVPGQLELRVEAGQGDALRIAGAAASVREVEQLQEKVRNDLARLEPIALELLQPPQVRALFMERLRAAGLAPKFKVVRSEPDLALRAVLTPSEIRAWETLFADFTRVHGSVLKISAQVESERDTVAALVATVVGGAFPYIVTTGGQRIAPGGSLAGHTVLAVRDGEIVLSDGLRVRFGP
jgi:type III secretion system YscD/HrpQ family protein